MNKIILAGTIGKDTEVHETSKTSIANTSLATHEWNGTESETVWHQIVLFAKNAENAEKLLKKGANVTIFGKLSYNEWTDKQDIKRTMAKIIVQEFEVQKFPEAKTQTNKEEQ